MILHALEFRKLLKTFLKPGSIIFDIGAYYGSYSLKYQELGYKVHAFEGSSNNADKFRRTCKGLSNITLHEVALNDHDSVSKTRFNDCNGDEHPEIEVKYVELDKYVLENKLPDPDYIKMDIEGMESVACKKMSNLIKNVRPIFQIEIHDDISFKKFRYSDYPSFVSTKEGGFDFNEFIKMGYNSYLFKSGILMPSKNFHREAQYFFVPKEKDISNPVRKSFLGLRDYLIFKYRILFHIGRSVDY